MNELALREGLDLLGSGDATAALDVLGSVSETGRPGFDGRLHAYRAQALQMLGRLDEAERAAARAVRIARQAEDSDALAAFRLLHQNLLGARAAAEHVERERERDRSLLAIDEASLLAGRTDAERAAILVRRAGALLDRGESSAARETCHTAFGYAAAAGDPREQVLALLCETRATPESALVLLARAHAIADRADEPNLITAVAHAARAAGVHLPPPEFG